MMIAIAHGDAAHAGGMGCFDIVDVVADHQCLAGIQFELPRRFQQRSPGPAFAGCTLSPPITTGKNSASDNASRIFFVANTGLLVTTAIRKSLLPQRMRVSTTPG